MAEISFLVDRETTQSWYARWSIYGVGAGTGWVYKSRVSDHKVCGPIHTGIIDDEHAKAMLAAVEKEAGTKPGGLKPPHVFEDPDDAFEKMLEEKRREGAKKRGGGEAGGASSTSG